MNLLKSFFSKDNATAKLSGWLILLTSLITLAGQFFHFPPKTYLILTLLSGALAVAAQFMQTNKVVSKSFWLTFAYTLLVYFSDSPLIVQIWPQAQKVIAFLGAAVKLITPMTTQQAADSKPPTADPLVK